MKSTHISNALKVMASPQAMHASHFAILCHVSHWTIILPSYRCGMLHLLALQLWLLLTPVTEQA